MALFLFNRTSGVPIKRPAPYRTSEKFRELSVYRASTTFCDFVTSPDSIFTT
jgi:hypothetical protein